MALMLILIMSCLVVVSVTIILRRVYLGLRKGRQLRCLLGTQAPVKIVSGTAGGRMVNSAGSPIPAGSLSTIAGGFFAGLVS